MSLILDALNRADNERKNQDSVPGLNTVHSSTVTIVEEKTGNKYGLYVAIFFAVVALIASVYWFVAKPGAATVSPPQPQADASSQPSVEESSRTTTKAEEVQTIAETKPVESIISPRPTAAVEQLYAAPEAQSAPSADPQINELYTAEEPAASESIEDPFVNLPAVVEEPTHITNTGRVAAETLPSRTFANIVNVQDFNELPWNTKQQIPTISYQRHNFLAGGVSTVVINGQTLGVGNIAASSQLVVQEIFEDGVVLKRGNVIFKLRALNGWINM
ncbi:general secretion pathway protein GspB [Cellvibrio mixtus]|uniref:general secretion pathway protein GspB n=1 Tax=Cellvibrio mixtus TaxID=39650 RepID=UPI000587AE9C|nr:general secretion pathway protein GspB [Cellvibrio mixtus]